ncbi:MAG TPA: kelch repeat-containing protein [Fimbriimonas sp.]|nr:kelch repeat-containing protein [Fimbriimonas sp.]
MQTKSDRGSPGPDRPALSRRDVLVGAAATALVTAVPAAASAAARSKSKRNPAIPPDMPVRRYMAAAAVLLDGRVLVTGGYDQPDTGRSAPNALCSAMIFDANNGRWTEVASMNSPRARHAAVTLRDGRVAVLGGMGMVPMSSIEVYDPNTDSWQVTGSLAQPRYDHMAVTDGYHVYVLGGSSQSIATSVETFHVDNAFSTSPQP